MYSIIQCQNSQYKVKPGDKILVEKLDLQLGKEFDSEQVLLIETEQGEVLVGQPFVKGAKYLEKVERQFKDKKMVIFKKKRRKNYRRTKGHRQELTELKVLAINY